MSTAAVHPPLPAEWRDFFALTKPRVVQLIVFCALIGMVLAVPGVPSLSDVGLAAVASLGIWLVAGAAAAFNCLVEKGIDAKMKRTAWRPTAKGELSDRQSLVDAMPEIIPAKHRLMVAEQEVPAVVVGQFEDVAGA